MIIFNDPPDWLDIEKRGVSRAYLVPDYFKGDGICVDIGTNVGGFPLVYGNRFSEVFCYEPATYSYGECLKNLKDVKNVNVFNLAVTNVTGELVKLRSHKHGNVSGNASLLNENEWNNSDNFEFVKTISFTDMIEQTKITGKKNYVKIDTEGSEYDMLMNADLSMINFLAVEIHIQLGTKKMNELMIYLLKYFTIIKSSGGMGNHYENTYKNLNI
jgi:FkbM family methyltransferase